MGFNICYIAAKLDVEDMAEAFELALAPPEEAPRGSGGRIGRLRGSGWTLLLCDDEGFGRKREAQIAALSQGREVYLCEVNETVMWSSAELWRDGAQLWQVTHAGDGEDVTDLSCTGEVPEALAGVRDTCEGLQKEADGVDYMFEIPLDLAAAAIGFRHEDVLGPEDVEGMRAFSLPRRKGLLARLFG